MRRRVIAMCALGASLSLVSFGAAWARPTWVIQTTPNAPGTRPSSLADVSCVTAANCYAVGGSYDSLSSSSQQRIVQHWNGTNWATVITPNPAGGVTNALRGVSCVTGFCVAVGFAGTHPLVERWNGASWTIDTIPIPEPGMKPHLDAVSCTSSSNCVAVGALSGESMASSVPALIARWNGHTWTRMTAPGGRDYDELNDIACTSSSSCLAVGGTYSIMCSGCYSPLAERWNGSHWSVVAPVRPPHRDASDLRSVACRAANDCLAVSVSVVVGSDDVWRYKRLAEHWNGSSWSIMTTPAPDAQTNFDGVSCAGGDCVVVGLTGSGQPLAERLHAGTWSIESIQQPTDGGVLLGVSCASRFACESVGVSYVGATSYYKTLAEESE